MKFKEMTPVTVQNFHYDLNEEKTLKNEINVSLRQVIQNSEDGSQDEGKDGKYFEMGVPFEISPEPGLFTVSGLITRVIQFENYFGDGTDLSAEDYQYVSKPLVDKIRELTAAVTSLTLGEAVNLNFEAEFNDPEEK
ncbi:DUF1149 family protein [Lactobacillus sp. PV037]|uniref:DUF1149 family protein n=1 Tax=unclassified Lactobacillus TaxID=2620435 RepID=UPI00223E9CFC|nr:MULTISPECIES: DUF1149 family protein [unclassified Lactobacillus]QNQ82579.1 DUF1149 family protein [Lactobacillus sp. PV012]QNQ83306.1 DUF1149 family protein [Lactobacillus sp. PV037]